MTSFQDQFTNLKPIKESPGMALMKAMGWAEGQGLGKESHGAVNPLMISVKTDKRGRSWPLPHPHYETLLTLYHRPGLWCCQITISGTRDPETAQESKHFKFSGTQPLWA